MTAVLGAARREVGGRRRHLVSEAHQVLLAPAAVSVQRIKMTTFGARMVSFEGYEEQHSTHADFAAD